MASVRDYMARDLIRFDPDQDIHDAIRLLLKHRVSGGPVVDRGGRLVGMLTDKDCLRVAFSASYHGEWGGQVTEFMTSEVTTVEADTDVIEVAQLFLDQAFHRFPVLEKGRLVGQISRHDILQVLDDMWGGF